MNKARDIGIRDARYGARSEANLSGRILLNGGIINGVQTVQSLPVEISKGRIATVQDADQDISLTTAESLEEVVAQQTAVNEQQQQIIEGLQLQIEDLTSRLQAAEAKLDQNDTDHAQYVSWFQQIDSTIGPFLSPTP